MRLLVVIVLDGVGVGALPDAQRYGDAGANTLAHVAASVPGFSLPNFARLGLGYVGDIPGVPPWPASDVPAAFGRLMTTSPAKDTVTGHWELMGCPLDTPLATFPQGFPEEIVALVEAAAGRPVLGNVAASGTEIIERLGREHIATGRPILYTSADSVLQLAAHEDVIPPAELHAICARVREALVGGPQIGRVIARPFAGGPGAFWRTSRRRDFALPPPRPTVLDAAVAAGLTVTGVGKVADIFAGRGFSRSISTTSNTDCLDEIVALLPTHGPGLVLANLLDFDMLYGHRNDPRGYARALVEVDARLPEILGVCPPGAVVFICADHGCDPTHPGTDHTREYVPVLVTGPEFRPPGVCVGTRPTLADVGATVAELMGVTCSAGQSFADALPMQRGA